MSRRSINFEDKKSTKGIFTKTKKKLRIKDVDINNILVSKKESYGTKNYLKDYIGHNDDDVIRPLCIKLPQMIGYLKCFGSKKAMSF